VIEFKIDFKMTGEYGLNKIYGGKHWTVRKADVQMMHNLVWWSMVQQHVPHKLFDKPVNIVVYYNDKLDSDNHGYMLKMIVDAMKGYLLVDDKRRYVHHTGNDFWDGNGILVRVEEDE